MAGYVVAILRAYPRELTENLAEIVNKIKSKIEGTCFDILKWEAVDIAFGYKALDLYFRMPEDMEGGTEALEDVVKSVEEIENVDVLYVTRIGA